MPGRRVHRSAVRAGVRNISHLGQRVEVKHADVTGRAGPRDIKVARIGIGGHIIESAIASHQLDFEHLVRAAVLCVGERGERKQNGEGCEDERFR